MNIGIVCWLSNWSYPLRGLCSRTSKLKTIPTVYRAIHLCRFSIVKCYWWYEILLILLGQICFLVVWITKQIVFARRVEKGQRNGIQWKYQKFQLKNQHCFGLLALVFVILKSGLPTISQSQTGASIGLSSSN